MPKRISSATYAPSAQVDGQTLLLAEWRPVRRAVFHLAYFKSRRCPAVSVLVAGGIGLAVRASWALVASRDPLRGDPAFYRFFGEAIASGRGYINPWSGDFTAYYPPGYPYFLGVVTFVQKMFDAISLPMFVSLVQASLGAVTAALAA